MRSYGRDKWVTTHIISPTNALSGHMGKWVNVYILSEGLYSSHNIYTHVTWAFMAIARLLITGTTILVPYLSHYNSLNDDVIKWKHFPRYWPFVRGIHRYTYIKSDHSAQSSNKFQRFDYMTGYQDISPSNSRQSDRAHFDIGTFDAVMGYSSNTNLRKSVLTHYPPVMPYIDKDIGEQCLR